MCYLIAKKFNQHGCIAVQAERGKALGSLVDYLGRKTYKHGVQIVTVSSKEAYGEYAPYEEVPSEQEFINRVFIMAQETPCDAENVKISCMA